MPKFTLLIETPPDAEKVFSLMRDVTWDTVPRVGDPVEVDPYTGFDLLVEYVRRDFNGHPTVALGHQPAEQLHKIADATSELGDGWRLVS